MRTAPAWPGTDPFDALDARAYLAFAAVAPLARPVREAITDAALGLAHRGVGGFVELLELREVLRAELAALLGVEAAQIGLTQGTTTSVIAIARSLSWRPGDRVITFAGEFPANVTPWRQAAEDFGLEHRSLSLDEPLAPHLADGRARLVAISAVQFASGLRTPLGPLAATCHAHGARLFVDAIQAVGAMPVDLAADGVDFAAGGGHKWLCGTDGAGWVYVAPGREGELGGAMAGWLSHVDGARFLFEPDQLREGRPLVAAPRVFEAGTSSSLAAAAMLAGVRMCAEADPARTFAHIQAWHDEAEVALRELGFTSERAPEPERRSGILSFSPPDGVTVAGLSVALAERGVVVTTPDGRLRVAPHAWTPLDRVEVLVDAVRDALSR